MAALTRTVRLGALVALLTVLVAGPAGAAGHAGDHFVPFAGDIDGRLIGFGDVPDGRCDNTPEGKTAWAVTSFEGWGNLSHLGRTYVYAEHCSYAGEEGPDGTYGEGELTLIAANRDVPRGTYTDGETLVPPPVVEFRDVFTFVDGGTGRFATASGGGVEMGFIDLADGSGAWRMEGVITYKRK